MAIRLQYYERIETSMNQEVWTLRMEYGINGGSFKYYSEQPTVGEVVDYILFQRYMSINDFDALVELASKYTKCHSHDGRCDQAVSVGVLNKEKESIMVSLICNTLHKSSSLDFQRVCSEQGISV